MCTANHVDSRASIDDYVINDYAEFSLSDKTNGNDSAKKALEDKRWLISFH